MSSVLSLTASVNSVKKFVSIYSQSVIVTLPQFQCLCFPEVHPETSFFLVYFVAVSSYVIVLVSVYSGLAVLCIVPLQCNVM